MKLLITFFLFVSLIHSSFASEQPNVVIFLLDDLRPDIGCYGNELIKSPNIDKLAEEGVLFNKAYCQQAICAPSRISILSGLRPETFAIYDITTRFRSIHKDAKTMPQVFKENGYQTVSIGKVYHHGYDDSGNWSIYYEKGATNHYLPGNPAFEALELPDTAYKDGKATAQAIGVLNQVKDDKFFMVLGLCKPHLPFYAPKKYWDLYDQDDFDIPVKEKPIGAYANAFTPWGELRGYDGIPDEGVLSDELTKELINGYYACVSYIDAQVGKVMQTLDDLNLRENTIVVFMSDHGYKIGEYGQWCKFTNFELDVNVPLIISRETAYAKRKTNVECDALVENVDVFPTLAEVCGLTIPKRDGKSLVSLLDNPDQEGDEAAYSVYMRGSIAMGCTVTDGEYRYTEWRHPETQAIIDVELYPCVQDFAVRATNLATLSAYNAIEARLKELLLKQYPADRGSFWIPTMPDETILLPNELKISQPTDGEKFPNGSSVKVEAVVGNNITEVKLVLNNDTLRSITDGDFVWGVNSTSDSELFNLPQGNHSIQLIAYAGSELISKKTLTITLNAPIQQGPYLDTLSIPGTIEAEHFDKGPEGVSYHDSDELNVGDGYRTEAVDLSAIEGGGYCISYFNVGEWLEYTIKVEKDADYDVEIQYSTKLTTGKVGMEFPDEDKVLFTDLSLPQTSTSNWTSFSTVVKEGVPLTKGVHVLRINMEKRGFNLDKVSFKMKVGTAVIQPTLSSKHTYPNPSKDGVFYLQNKKEWVVYSISGKRILSGNSTKIDLSGYTKGVYVLKSEMGTTKLVVE